ncbi:MAG: CesT family type III secretion system chaperone [Sutterella sp.]
MAFNLASAVAAVAHTAGWRQALPDENGVYHYFLENGLDLDIRSPDGRTCILSADLGEAPDPNMQDAESELIRIGRLAAGIQRRRSSVLSVNEGRLELFRTVDLNAADERRLAAEVRDFLNDQAWWRLNLQGASAASSSPFSMQMSGWFPGELSF